MNLLVLLIHLVVLCITFELAFSTPVDSKSCGCFNKYEPVCGSDRQIYENICEFNCAKRINTQLYEISSANCRDSQIRKTSNDTQFTSNTLRDNSPIHDQYTATHPCNCVLVLAPVCGSDGKTYINSCGLNCAAKENIYLKIAYDGNCRAEISSDQQKRNQVNSEICDPCPGIYDPVCGSDEKTYPSQCAFNCEMRKHPTKQLRINHWGACNPSRPNDNIEHCPSCPTIYDPVCGNNNRTYPNQCALECEIRKDSYNRLRIAHRGECHINHMPAPQGTLGTYIYTRPPRTQN